MPFQLVFSATDLLKFFSKAIISGCPQLRSLDNRITCQVGPLSSISTPPAKHPLEYEPNAFGDCFDGNDIAPNKYLACFSAKAVCAFKTIDKIISETFMGFISLV